jgi:hypothetical protein
MIPSPRPVPYSAKTERQAFNRTLAITAELLRPRSGPVFCDRCDRQELRRSKARTNGSPRENMRDKEARAAAC